LTGEVRIVEGDLPDPHQFNNEDRDGLRNVGFYKTEPTLPG